MDRRWALAAVWAVFATASVGVGFAAAGLVGDPFGDPGDPRAVASVPTSAAGGPDTATASPGSSPSSTATPRPVSTGDGGATVRSVTTRAGFVAGSCRDGLVTVSASPAIGWQIDDVDHGRLADARVRFEATGGDGRVEVHAWCAGETARFSVDNRDNGDDGGGGGGSGSSGPGGGDG